MKHIGRNDLCPCGSGKKYKKCCLVSAEVSDFQYRRFRQTHAELIPRLTEFAFNSLDPESIEAAWLDFNDQQTTEPFDPESPMNVLFMPWFLFNWILHLKPPGRAEFVDTTIAEQFLIHHLNLLDSDEQALLLNSIRCPYTLCEVAEVKPGVGMVLFDLLRQMRYEVVERSASETLKRGEIIYCATSEVVGFSSNVGTGPFALRPTAKREVLRLRKWILNQIGTGEITSEHLHEFEHDIRGLYLYQLAALLTPPQLANTDGDLMLPQKLYFEIESADRAFHALKTLAKGWKEEELLQRAELKEGSVVKVELEWLGGRVEARERLGGPVMLGLIKIDNEQLIVEVNSNKRASRIRRMIERRLEGGVKYKTTLIEPIQAQIQEAWHAAMAGDSESQKNSAFAAANRTLSADEDRELQTMIEKAARQHWNSWFDLPVPALDDMTPREAAGTEEGRELLNSLLLLYEHSADDKSENVLKPDVAALRRELGMEQSR